MQSSFCSNRDNPQSHLPPSPRAPTLRISCGQLKAGIKKSPGIDENLIGRSKFDRTTDKLYKVAKGRYLEET